MLLLTFGSSIPNARAQTFAYLPNYGDGNVVRVDLADEALSTVALSDQPYGAAVTRDGARLFVTRTAGNIVTTVATDHFDDAGSQVHIAVGNSPRGVAVTPNGTYAFVTNYSDGTVSQITVSSLAVTDTIAVGAGPWGIAAHYDEAAVTFKVYVANFLAGTISVITSIGTTTIAVGDGPLGVALTPDGRWLYVANYADDTVTAIRTSDNRVMDLITVGDGPWGVAVGQDGAVVYVANSLADSVSVIRTSDNTLVRTYPAGNQPTGVAATLNGDIAYAVNQLSDSVTRIDHQAQTVDTILQDQLNGAYALGVFIGGTAPDAPSGLTATSASENRIDLSWTDDSSDELGFKIERRRSGDTTYQQIAKVGTNITTYRDADLSSNTTYQYRIRSYNEAADSSYTSVAGATTEESSDDFSWCFIGTLLK
jgi:YVTN family beta-propeller protein